MKKIVLLLGSLFLLALDGLWSEKNHIPLRPLQLEDKLDTTCLIISNAEKEISSNKDLVFPKTENGSHKAKQVVTIKIE